MNKKGLTSLVVLSSCSLLLSPLQVAEAEETSELVEEQVTTVETDQPESSEIVEESETKPSAPLVEETKPTEASDETTPLVEEISTPVLHGIAPKKITEGESFDPTLGVTASDEKDGDLTDQIKVTGKIDSDKPGSYSLTYSVANSEGQSTSETTTVQVERVSVRRLYYDLEIADFSVYRHSDLKKEIINRLVLKDMDGNVADLADVTLAIDQPAATDTLGEKKIKISVTAADSTVSEKTITVSVQSGLRIETRNLVLNLADAFNPYAGISAFEKRMDGTEVELKASTQGETSGIEVIKNNVNTFVPGNYEVVYRITNSFGETAERAITVSIVNPQLPQPTISVNDQVLYVGDILTSEMILGWANVTNASYYSYEVIGDQIYLDSDQRLTDSGVYRIRYTATNEDGNRNSVTEKEIILTVKERATYSNQNYRNNYTRRTTPQMGSVSTEKKLPQTGEKQSSFLTILAGISMIFFAFFAKKEHMIKKITGSKK